MSSGDGACSFAVIESGTADVFVDDALVRSVGPGDVLGELAVLGDGQRTATVTASTPLRMFAFFGLEFNTLEQDHPELAAKIREVMTERQD